MENKGNKKAIDTLNNLLEINHDRIEGYHHAAKETNESDLKHTFMQFAETSFKCQKQLVEEIKKLGGKPVTGTRTTGKLYRAWMDIKAALAGKSRKAILSSCEFGEDVAVENYKDALKEHTIESNLYPLIQSQYAEIKEDHDIIKKMRDSVAKTKPEKEVSHQ